MASCAFLRAFWLLRRIQHNWEKDYFFSFLEIGSHYIAQLHNVLASLMLGSPRLGKIQYIKYYHFVAICYDYITKHLSQPSELSILI